MKISIDIDTEQLVDDNYAALVYSDLDNAMKIVAGQPIGGEDGESAEDEPEEEPEVPIVKAVRSRPIIKGEEDDDEGDEDAEEDYDESEDEDVDDEDREDEDDDDIPAPPKRKAGRPPGKVVAKLQDDSYEPGEFDDDMKPKSKKRVVLPEPPAPPKRKKFGLFGRR